MAIRSDSSILLEIDIIDTINDKTAMRSFLLNQWISESPSSKYRYFVETLGNGNRIYLERPGQLNKGCDFIIFIENHILFKNGNDKPPPHGFILDDLLIKKKLLSITEWELLQESIEAIYNCEKFDSSFNKCTSLPIVGESYELILKTLRWLFIEQDITYWSGKGRKMLYDAILKL